MFLKIPQDTQENTSLLECIFKSVLKFTFKSILQVPSCEICEIFKRTFSTEHLRTSASAVGLLIIYLYVCVITLYCASNSIQIIFNRSFNLFFYVSDRAGNDFSFDDF